MIEQIAQTLQQAESAKKVAFRLAAGLVLGALVIGVSVMQATQIVTVSRNGIYVKGLADTLVKADRAVWRGSFSARHPDYVTAVLQIEKDRARVRKFLVASGIDSSDILFQAVNTYPQYKMLPSGMQTSAIDFYTAEQTVEVASAQVTLLERLGQQVEPLLREGVMFMAYQPEFYVGGIEEIKIKLLGAASRNARDRAEILAAVDGAQVGPLKTSRQGVFQITALNSTEDDGYGVYDTRTIDKRVRIVVTNEYALQ